MKLSTWKTLLSLVSITTLTSAQLTGKVGPTTSTASKQATICNVLNYGGSVGSSVRYRTCNGSAFTNCVLKHKGSTLYVPPGNYGMQTWQTLTGASQWALQMDGVITRESTTGGHMIVVENANDFEFFSSNSAGAIQGNGYQCRNAGPRLIRIITSTNWSLHDLILVDSPEFHLIVQEGSNGEVYNLAIRGTNLGGSDGVDISGVNHWVHDVEVTNRDECVTIKSPASNILVERIWCNQSGGSAIGSMGAGTAIENILYRNVYTNGGNQIFMIKSWGGDGYLRNVLLQNFIARGTAYGLDVNQYWSGQTQVAGNGVQINNVTFQNWSATNKATNKCESSFGTGSCLRGGTPTSFAVTTTSIGMPSGFTNPPSLSGDLSQGFATNSPIPIPTIPTTFYPGLPQISPLAKNK
ncbi:rhamnogalacturonan-hydrolase [Schizopora paradoxa]|uniref:Rhamnogalacturonan-hydrolase n=1 Tax=Schizopora paradoxa TaxID=27342 RepID=A0A0H2RN69_9AGAM|nr:rhamnogalacturonan-hydrolase [Schizopora paradoxa]